MLIILLSFFFIYIFNILHPIFGDDWRYSMMDDGLTRIKNISDIYHSLYNHYFEWGGRIIVHIIDEILLLLNEYTADFINSLAFVGFSLIIYKTANLGNSLRPSLLLAINMLIFFFIPAFGSTILWITGSSNYLWGTLIVLCFLYFYVKQVLYPDEKDQWGKSILIFAFGILAGWTNENVAVALIAMLIGFILYYKVQTGKIPVWAIAGLAGALVGALLMIAAPGNYARMGSIVYTKYADQSPIGIYISQFFAAISGYYYYVLTPTFIYLVTFWIYCTYGKQENKVAVRFISLLFVAGAVIAVLAMTASPIFPGRAAFGSISFIFVATGILAANMDYSRPLVNRLIYTTLIFALLVFAADYYRGYRVLKEVDTHLRARQQVINEGKDKGITDFVLEDRISPESRFLHYFELTPDAEDWHNRMYSGYNDIHSIIIK